MCNTYIMRLILCAALLQMYYHHNIVQQLKHLHDVTLYQEHFQDLSAGSLTPSSFPGKGDKGEKGEKGGGGGKKEDRSGGTSKRGGGAATGKEKRGTKIKEELGTVNGTP